MKLEYSAPASAILKAIDSAIPVKADLKKWSWRKMQPDTLCGCVSGNRVMLIWTHWLLAGHFNQRFFLGTITDHLEGSILTGHFCFPAHFYIFYPFILLLLGIFFAVQSQWKMNPSDYLGFFIVFTVGLLLNHLSMSLFFRQQEKRVVEFLRGIRDFDPAAAARILADEGE